MITPEFEPKRYRTIAHLTAAAICLLFALIQYGASSSRSESARSEWEARLNQQNALIGQSERLKDRLVGLRSDEQNLLVRLEKARRRAPNTRDDHDFLEQLASAAETRELTIQELQPESSVRIQAFDRTTIRMTAAGSWSGVCQFLNDVRNTERLCSVDEFHITVADRSRDELLVTLAIDIFSSPAPEVARSAEGVLQ